MYLSREQSRHLAQVMEVLTDAHSGLELRRALAEPMLKLLHADYYVSYEWDAASRRFTHGIAHNLPAGHVAAYEARHQDDDPITPQLQRHRAPTLVTQVLPQAVLVKSEFFSEFIGREGLYWGVNLFAFPDADHSSDLRIWRSRHRSNFDAADLDLLRLIYPAFGCALRRTRSTLPTGVATPANDPFDTIEARLVQQGRLSQREAQVAARAAAGASDKEIARDLGIEFTTVRTHLAKAFRKLGVENRGKLASLLARWPLQ